MMLTLAELTHSFCMVEYYKDYDYKPEELEDGLFQEGMIVEVLRKLNADDGFAYVIYSPELKESTVVHEEFLNFDLEVR